MFSADGEFVDFTHPVLLEGPVEVFFQPGPTQSFLRNALCI